MANDGEKRRWPMYVAGAALSLVLIGLGVGIGALVWNDSPSTETAAPQAAPQSAQISRPADTKSRNLKNYNVGATMYFSGLPNGGVTMKVQYDPQQDSNCVKDVTLGDFPVTNASEFGLSMRVKSDFDEGSCFYEQSWQTWQISLPGGGGRLGIYEQRTGGAESVHWYEAQCQPGWTGGWSCSDDSDLGRAGFHKFFIKKA